MRFKLFSLLVVAAAVFGSAAQAQNTPYRLGDTIPGSTAITDQNGKTQTFESFRGKPVVLEWHNSGCPFVAKHYESGNMQKLQETYTGKGVVWVAVNSGAKGKQGYLNPSEAAGAVAKYGFKGTAYALDAEGKLGKAFGAETTPHMFILDATGKLVYMGAIDSIPSFNKDDIAKADNYVAQNLDALLAGQPVPTAQTNPYGCSVKY